MLRRMNLRGLALPVVLLVAFAAGAWIHRPSTIRAQGQSSSTAPGTCTGCTTRVASSNGTPTALHTAAILSTACDDTTATATGALTSDTLSVDFAADPTAVTGYIPATTGGLQIYFFTTSGTAHFKVCNPTSGSITPGAVSLNWVVSR